MRLLLCNYEYPPLGGGGGVVMAALARELARRHEVFVLTSGGLGLPRSEVDSGVQVRRAPVWFRNSLAVANLPSMLMYLPSGLAAGVKLLSQQRFDVINTHFVVPTGPLGAALATLFSVPNVVSVHGGDLYDPSKKMSPHRQPLLHPAIRRMLRRADAVVGQSKDTLERVRSIYHVDRATDLIPLGIERPPPRSQDARQQLDIPESSFVMVAVGRVVARKAAPQLAEVLAGLRDPQALLLVVGDGPEAGAVLRAASERGVAGQLRHLGQVSDATKYLALSAADVFVSTSQHEGFGLVFLEAHGFRTSRRMLRQGWPDGFPRHAAHRCGRKTQRQTGVHRCGGFAAP